MKVPLVRFCTLSLFVRQIVIMTFHIGRNSPNKLARTSGVRSPNELNRLRFFARQ